MATLLNSAGVLRPRGPSSLVEPAPTEELTPIADLDPMPFRQEGMTLLGFPVELPQPKQTVTSYVQGVSLANVLQMLHLERMTCLLEVTADQQFGTLTLVNGELVDADANGLDGEEAVYAILAWPQPHTTILDGVTLFRNTVKSSLAALIVEAVRRQDERERGPLTTIRPETAPGVAAQRADEPARDGDGDWEWLVETLVISGASAAAVVRVTDECVLAQASERHVGAQATARDVTGELAPVVRAAVHWGRYGDAAVDEVALRLGERHALIVPLDRTRDAFVCATFAQTETIEFASSAVRSLTR